MRVLLISMRDGAPEVFRSMNFEAEDVIVDLLDADRVDRDAGVRAGRVERVARGLRRSRGARGVYDLVLVSVMGCGDLASVGDVRALTRLGNRSACLITEAWARGVSGTHRWVRDLSMFDAVFCSCAGAVEPLREATGRRVQYLAPGIDALRWTDEFDAHAERPIDVLWFGRRVEHAHAAIRRAAARRGWFYVYTTAQPGACADHEEHRAQLRAMIGRSKAVVVYPAKADQPELVQRDAELGFRYYEAAAGGATLVGDHPETEHWFNEFGARGGLVRLPRDPEGVERALSGVISDHDGAVATALGNATHALTRHDVVHRLEVVLAELGLEPTQTMLERKAALSVRLSELMSAGRGEVRSAGRFAIRR